MLEIGHHGSYSSTSSDFLSKVNPKYAVIMVGKDNSYGHPHKETMEKLKSKGIKVYRTDQSGTIVIISDGKNVIANGKQGDYSYSGGESAAPSSPNNNLAPQVKQNPPPALTPNINKSVVVYRTKTGGKYHVDGCRYLNKSKIEIILGEAKNLGLEPCSVCQSPQ